MLSSVEHEKWPDYIFTHLHHKHFILWVQTHYKHLTKMLPGRIKISLQDENVWPDLEPNCLTL